jgi:hypothetical protein
MCTNTSWKGDISAIGFYFLIYKYSYVIFLFTFLKQRACTVSLVQPKLVSYLTFAVIKICVLADCILFVAYHTDTVEITHGKVIIVAVENIKYCSFSVCNCSLRLPSTQCAYSVLHCSLWPLCTVVFHMSPKRQDFRAKILLNVKYVYSFWRFIIQEEFNESLPYTCIGLHLKYELLSSDFKETCIS